MALFLTNWSLLSLGSLAEVGVGHIACRLTSSAPIEIRLWILIFLNMVGTMDVVKRDVVTVKRDLKSFSL